MVRNKEKTNKLTVRPSKREGTLTTPRSYDLWTDLDRVFDDFRSGFEDLFWPWGQRSITEPFQQRTPAMDLADLGDHYEMRVEMPGIPKDKIDIQVTQNSVEISASHDEQQEETNKNWLRRERTYANFYRCLELPEELKTDDVNAELDEGILTLTLPKVEPKQAYKSRKIHIK
jgi:HSP20 family protein